MSIIKCKECNKEYSNKAKQCPNCGNPTTSKNNNSKWTQAKLITGIISIILFILISIQSCAAGIANTLINNNSVSGSAGIICAFCMLIGDIITITTRNSEKDNGTIASICFYWIGTIITIGNIGIFHDLAIWSAVCFIFGLINLGSILSKKSYFSTEKNKKLLLIGIIIISIVSLILGVSQNTDSNNNNSSNNSDYNYDNVESDYKNGSTEKNKKINLDETFVLDEMELTISSNITYDTVDNEFSDYHRATAVKLPITVKNISNETKSLNSFYYSFFGSKGIEINDLGFYFDDSINDGGNLKPTASYTKYFYMPYDGNGKYSIEFNDFKNEYTLDFEINK